MLLSQNGYFGCHQLNSIIFSRGGGDNHLLYEVRLTTLINRSL